MVSFNVRPKEADIINRLAYRALAMDNQANGRHARKLIDWQMDFTATHANGCPLRLAALADADDFNFAHDAFGIARHLNRETGELENCFLPRFHAPTVTAYDR